MNIDRSSKNDAGVFHKSPRYLNETYQSEFVENFVKTKADAKSFV